MIEKKTVRTDVPYETHQALKVLVAQSPHMSIDRYVEDLLVKHVARKSHAAIMLAESLREAGIDRTFRESMFGGGEI